MFFVTTRRFRALMSARTDLQLTSNISISDGGGHNNLDNIASSSSALSASSMLAGLGSFGRGGVGGGGRRGGVPPEFSRGNPAYDVAHHAAREGGNRNRDYMNTFSSTSSFTLPSIIGEINNNYLFLDFFKIILSKLFSHARVLDVARYLSVGVL